MSFVDCYVHGPKVSIVIRTEVVVTITYNDTFLLVLGIVFAYPGFEQVTILLVRLASILACVCTLPTSPKTDFNFQHLNCAIEHHPNTLLISHCLNYLFQDC